MAPEYVDAVVAEPKEEENEIPFIILHTGFSAVATYVPTDAAIDEEGGDFKKAFPVNPNVLVDFANGEPPDEIDDPDAFDEFCAKFPAPPPVCKGNTPVKNAGTEDDPKFVQEKKDPETVDVVLTDTEGPDIDPDLQADQADGASGGWCSLNAATTTVNGMGGIFLLLSLVPMVIRRRMKK
ncbi:MAG: hypothetical protein HN337_01265 [Deltaproteobacteria bacterium]|jgi:hypothetical protein|nr:hypothetical protein [Deltaproteobacteria bacterium]